MQQIENNNRNFIKISETGCTTLSKNNESIYHLYKDFNRDMKLIIADANFTGSEPMELIVTFT